jgi:hypothetical protein
MPIEGTDTRALRAAVKELSTQVDQLRRLL